VDHYYDLYLSLQNSPDAGRRSRSISRMHQSLIQAQELGDEKMQIVNHMQEIIDGKLRQLDTDQQNLDLKEERDRYASLLEDGQPSKLQRLQSPMREQGNQAGTGNGGLNGNGLLSAKDHYALGGYAGGVVPGSSAMPSGNGGSSTPNSERSSHVSNGGNSGSNGNVSGGGGGGAGGDLQRTGSKRSRRRNESLVNNGSSLEMGGNESNSANEASGSGGGSGERKSSLGGASGAGIPSRAPDEQIPADPTSPSRCRDGNRAIRSPNIMINPIASESEAINSATYVDNYIDSVENLPDDVQRQLSRIRDIDVQYRGEFWPRFPRTEQ